MEAKKKAATGDIFMSEVSASPSSGSNPSSTAFIELVNLTGRELNIGNFVIYPGTNDGGFAVLTGEDYFTIPAHTSIPSGGYLTIGNGATQTVFETAWGLSEDEVTYLRSNVDLQIGIGSPGRAFQLQNPSARSVIDTSPEVPVDQHAVQESEGNWNEGGSSDDSTPGEQSAGQTLPVTLSSFTAVQSSNLAKLNWVTQSECNLIGFNLYRSYNPDSGSSTIMTQNLITATNSNTTSSYSFIDNEVEFGATYYYWLESVEMSGYSNLFGPVTLTIMFDKEDESIEDLPAFTTLQGAYPNPFNPDTTIKFSVKEFENATLDIFNIKGQSVKTFSAFDPGYHEVIWRAKNNNGDSVGSGVYFYRLKSSSVQDIGKLILLK